MKWILFILVFLSLNVSSYQVLRSEGLALDETIVGRGVNLDNLNLSSNLFHRLKSSCLLGEINEYGQKSSKVEFFNYVSFDSKNEFIRIKGKAKVDFWIASAKASTEYLMEESSTSTKESNAIKLEILGPKYRFENIVPDYEKLNNGVNLCGDGYIHSGVKGVSQTLSAGLEFFSKEDKEKFTAKLKIKLAGGLIKKTFKYKDEHKEYFENAVMTISHNYKGGMTQELLKIRDYQPSSTIKYRCKYEDIDYCVGKFDEYYQYLTSDEYQLEVSDSEIYDFIYFGVSTYDEAAIEGITRELESELSLQYQYLIDLSHTLQRYYSERSKLESEQLLYAINTQEYELLQININKNNVQIQELVHLMEDCYDDVSLCHGIKEGASH